MFLAILAEGANLAALLAQVAGQMASALIASVAFFKKCRRRASAQIENASSAQPQRKSESSFQIGPDTVAAKKSFRALVGPNSIDLFHRDRNGAQNCSTAR
jgi:hypothetical protein